MTVIEVTVVLCAVMMLLMLLGVSYVVGQRIGYNSGYSDGLEEAVPMHGECGECGESFEGGTIADAIAKAQAHECADEVG